MGMYENFTTPTELNHRHLAVFFIQLAVMILSFFICVKPVFFLEEGKYDLESQGSFFASVVYDMKAHEGEEKLFRKLPLFDSDEERIVTDKTIDLEKGGADLCASHTARTSRAGRDTDHEAHREENVTSRLNMQISPETVGLLSGIYYFCDTSAPSAAKALSAPAERGVGEVTGKQQEIPARVLRVVGKPHIKACHIAAPYAQFAGHTIMSSAFMGISANRSAGPVST